MKFQKSFTFTLLSVAIAIAAGCTAQAETASAKVAAAPQQIAYIRLFLPIPQKCKISDRLAQKHTINWSLYRRIP